MGNKGDNIGLVCKRCGSVDDYRAVPSGPHLKAICNGCGRYIKFIKQSNTKTMSDQTQWGAPTQPQQQQNNNRPLAEGVRLFSPHPNAPDFVLASLILTLDELFAFCKNNPQYLVDYQGKKQIKLQVLQSKEGKLYSVVDTYGTPAQPSNAEGQWGQGRRQQQGNWGQGGQQQQAPQQQPSSDDLPF